MHILAHSQTESDIDIDIEDCERWIAAQEIQADNWSAVLAPWPVVEYTVVASSFATCDLHFSSHALYGHAR